LGLAYIKQERFADALPIFEKLPSNPRVRQLLATCLVETGQNARALEALQPLLAAAPADTGLLYLQGLALTRLKRLDEAHEVWTRMMASANPAQANFLMGKASYETGSFEPAADYFRKALEADPNLRDAHRELGKTLVSLRDNAAAAKELRLADPADPEALYFLGGVLAQESDPAAAATLEKARAMNPDFWGPYYYLGKLEFEQGKLKEALVNLEHAAKLKPDQSGVVYQLGRAYQKAGRSAEAQAAFEKVKQLKAAAQQQEAEALGTK
jgi:tetratricopeptide (TPR) repeat protein